jgi:hypothetical protein
VKNTIKKSLLTIMLLFGAMNIQSSEADGDGGPAIEMTAQDAIAPEASDLILAVSNNDTATVRKIVSENPHLIHEKNLAGEDSLSIAILNDFTEIIEILIDFGADVNEKYESNLTPLHLSVFYEKTASTELLLKHGVNLHSKCDNGLNPITCAYFYKKHEAFKLLVKTDSNSEKLYNLLRETIQKSIIQLRSSMLGSTKEALNISKSILGQKETNTILQLLAKEVKHADI